LVFRWVGVAGEADATAYMAPKSALGAAFPDAR